MACSNCRYNFPSECFSSDKHLFIEIRQQGAVLVDNVANISTLLDDDVSAEQIAIEAEFKVALNAYLSELKVSPVRSLADVIAFNNKFPDEVC